MHSARRTEAVTALAGLAMAGLALGAVALGPADAGVRLEGPAEPPVGPRAPFAETLPDGPLAEGDEAPGFDLPSIEGGSLGLEEFRGRQPVLLVAWAVWCPPCIGEFEELKILHGAYARRGLQILAVGVRYNQTIEEVRGFARDLQLPFPVLYDESEKVVQRFGISFIPSNYLIDRSGVIRMTGNGLPEDLDARIEEVLARP